MFCCSQAIILGRGDASQGRLRTLSVKAVYVSSIDFGADPHAPLLDMSQLGTPDYRALADRAIQVYGNFAAQYPDAKRDHSSKEPRCRGEFGPLDFEKETPRELDRYLAGNFVEDSWIGKLESDVEGEEGLYNVAVSALVVQEPYETD